jgi:hypothetical protein
MTRRDYYVTQMAWLSLTFHPLSTRTVQVHADASRLQYILERNEIIEEQS